MILGLRVGVFESDDLPSLREASAASDEAIPTKHW